MKLIIIAALGTGIPYNTKIDIAHAYTGVALISCFCVVLKFPVLEQQNKS